MKFKMRIPMALLAAALAAPAAALPTSAKHVPRAKAEQLRYRPRLDRDCVPYNGPYGYYGNPWCDTGSSRPPDIEFRERQRYRNR